MDRNINDIENVLDDSLYNELLLIENIVVPPEKFNNKLNAFLDEFLKKKIEQKCISEGYIKKDSVNIIKKSIGSLEGSQFNGNISYKLMYKALVCFPKTNNIIKCRVKLVNNKLGLLGNNGPLTIIVGKQLHNNPSLLDEINVDDIIEVKIIESKFSLDDKEIRILAKLKIDTDIIKKDVDIDDLNDIDNEEVDDKSVLSNKINIDNMDLESLNTIDSDDDLDQLDDEDIEQDDEDIEQDDEDMEQDDEDMERDDEDDNNEQEINDEDIDDNNIDDEDDNNYS